MDRLFLALRYVRQRPLAWVSFCAIWISLTALVCVVGIMNGFLDETRRVIRGTTADIVLTPLTVRAPSGRRLAPPPYESIERVVAAVDGVAAVAPHLLRPSLIALGRKEDGRLVIDVEEARPVQVVALDPERDAEVTRFLDYVRAVPPEKGGVPDPSRPFEPPAGAGDLPVLLLGEGLAREARLERGAVVTVVTVPEEEREEGQPPRVAGVRFVVGGLVRTGHFQNDSITAYTSLEGAARLSSGPPTPNEICVRASDGADVAAVAGRIREAVRRARLPVLVETWLDRHGRYLAAVENQRAILFFILFFFVAIACFNVFATLTLLVSDKVRDIGVLAALGASRGRIAGLFLLCALVIGAPGAALGAATGVFVGRRLDALNDAIERLTGVRVFRPDVYVFDHVPVRIDPPFVAMVAAAALGLAMASALLPALRAARLDPVEALRRE